ncbi:MAG: DEAD/DEAH box helicase [Pseudomonadota bacterium]
MTTFAKLALHERIQRALDTEGYTTPTPIQAQAIPSVLERKDLLGIAQTGTGKTAAFALPIIDRLISDPKKPMHKGCRCLILSPTRELATQIADSFRTYGRHTNLYITTIFGGVGAKPQIRALARGIDVLVATPGRLLDHMGEGYADLSSTEILVLDEADQMLDLGFLKPIRTIAGQTSRRRQSLFFSATMPKEIAGLANELLNDPVKVQVSAVASTAENVAQRVLHVSRQQKVSVLKGLLDDNNMVRTLVFTRTKRGADRVAKHLTTGGLKVRAIHGNKSQNQRQQALDAFRADKVQVLVATDIAARGIDIPAVSHVVNFELPEIPESYVHRIGRTARAGLSGEAISLCDASERGLLRDIERVTRQTIPSERVAPPPGSEADDDVVVDDDRGRRGTNHGRPQKRQGRAAHSEGPRPARAGSNGRPHRGQAAAGSRKEGNRSDASGRNAPQRVQNGEGRRPRSEGEARSDAARPFKAKSAPQRANTGDGQHRGARGSQARQGDDRRNEEPRGKGRNQNAGKPHRADGGRSDRNGQASRNGSRPGSSTRNGSGVPTSRGQKHDANGNAPRRRPRAGSSSASQRDRKPELV